MRQKRQAEILQIISDNDIKTQEQLTESLKALGYDTTQATVSRDIKEMGLIKISSGNGGYKYAAKPSASVEKKHIDIFSDAIISIDYALHTIVVRTYPGMAPAVCASCDIILGNRVLGSIAGDDTLMIITRSENSAKDICEELKRIFKR